MTYLLLEKILRIACSLLVTYFTISRLGITGFGIYSAYLLPVSLVLLLSSSGIRNYLRTKASSATANYQYIVALSSEIYLSLFLCLPAFAYYVLVLRLSPLAALATTVICALSSIFNCFELEEITYVVRGRANLLASILCIQLILATLFKLLILFYFPSPFFLFYGHAIEQFISSVLILFCCPGTSVLLQSFSRRNGITSWLTAAKHLRAQRSQLFVEAQLILQSKADQLILASIFSPSVFGLYALCLRGFELLRVLLFTISSYFLPRLSEPTTSPSLRNTETYKYISYGCALPLIMTIFVLLLVPLNAYFKFLPVIYPFHILLTSLLVLSIGYTTFYLGYTLSVSTGDKVFHKYSSLIFVVYLFAVFFLSSEYGLVGALVSLSLLYIFQSAPYIRRLLTSLSLSKPGIP